MIRFSKLVVASSLLCGLLGTSALAQDGNVALTASLSAASEVPSNASTASGSLEASFNQASGLLTYTVSYSGLTGPAKAAHFHGPAMPGANAGVVLPFTGSVESPHKGSATLTAAQAADLLAGKWYVNVHTAANPGGEIRGQVMPK